MEENKVGLPDRQFVATRQEILDLLELIVPEGGLKYKNAKLLQQLIDSTVNEIGWIWFVTMDEKTKERLSAPTN